MSTTETPAPPFLQPLVSQRRQVAIGLVVAGVILAVLAAWWGVWGFARSDRAVKQEGKVVVEDVGKPEAAPDDNRPKHSADYQFASIWAGLLAALALVAAWWVYAHPADPTAPLTGARTEFVAIGGILGLLTTLFGAALGYRWYPSAVAWIGSKNPAEAKWVLYAAGIFLGGLIIMFASLQVARVEERANATLRRVLYGFNSVFMGLLLLLVLVVVNVAVFIKVPATLATNQSAFTGLSEESKTFLHSLDQPVHAYLIMPESHIVPLVGGLSYDTMYADCRGLLTACEDESPNFHASFLSPAFDADRIANLFQRLKIERAPEQDYGILVTVGDDESAHAYIRDGELISVEQRALVFQAESRLMTELNYLTDRRGNEKVYVTQKHGEPNFEGGEPGEPTMNNVVQYLRDKKFTVASVDLDTPGAKVPDDAALVMVPGLRRTLAPDSGMYIALRDYLHRADRPGKLFLCLPAFRNPQNKVAATGLEPLLMELGVDVETGFRLLSIPPREHGPESVVVGPVAGMDKDVARIVRGGQYVFRDTRMVRKAPAPPGGNRQVSYLLGTESITFQDDNYSQPPAALIAAMRGNPELQREKKLTQRAWPVAVAVADTVGEKRDKRPRALVFGSETFLLDRPEGLNAPEELRQLMVGDGIEWLRGRSAASGIAPRKVGVFTLERPIEWSSQAVLLGLVSVGIAVLGLGVWLSRRR